MFLFNFNPKCQNAFWNRRLIFAVLFLKRIFWIINKIQVLTLIVFFPTFSNWSWMYNGSHWKCSAFFSSYNISPEIGMEGEGTVNAPHVACQPLSVPKGPASSASSHSFSSPFVMRPGLSPNNSLSCSSPPA